jgi:hypothetical protein
MKCNLAAPSPLSIVPAPSFPPLALGAVAIASALATQRLDSAPPRGGRHGRRSRARTNPPTDRRGEKEGRHPALSAAVGLPEATAEIIDSLGEHRVLSTEQVRTIHLPGRSLRRTQQILAGIEEAGLIRHVDTRVAPRRLWFVSERGAALAFELVGLETQPRVLQAADAAGALRAHTLAVNNAAICFLKAARERGDEFGPFSWRQENAHPMSRGRGRRRRTLFADAVLTYLRREQGGTALEQRFLELDRATLSVDRLVAELSRYAQLYRATDAEGQPLLAQSLSSLPAGSLRADRRLPGSADDAADVRVDAPARPPGDGAGARRGVDRLLPSRRPAAEGAVRVDLPRSARPQAPGRLARQFARRRGGQIAVRSACIRRDRRRLARLASAAMESYCRRTRQSGRAARKRPRPGAEGLSFGAMFSLEASGFPAPPGDRACRSSGACEQGGDQDGA